MNRYISRCQSFVAFSSFFFYSTSEVSKPSYCFQKFFNCLDRPGRTCGAAQVFDTDKFDKFKPDIDQSFIGQILEEPSWGALFHDFKLEGSKLANLICLKSNIQSWRMKVIAKGIKKCNVFIGALFVSEILTLLAFIDVSTTFPSYKHVSNLEGCKDRILAKISVLWWWYNGSLCPNTAHSIKLMGFGYVRLDLGIFACLKPVPVSHALLLLLCNRMIQILHFFFQISLSFFQKIFQNLFGAGLIFYKWK